jgi:hypothetical protein
MVERLRGRLTYANVTATIALFLALSGGIAWALERDSVKSRHIVDGQVKAADIDENARAHARVLVNGTIQHSKGVNDVVIANPDPGAANKFCFDLNFAPTAVVGSPYAANNAVVATALRDDSETNACPFGFDALVRTFAANTGTDTPVSFSVVFAKD